MHITAYINIGCDAFIKLRRSMMFSYFGINKTFVIIFFMWVRSDGRELNCVCLCFFFWIFFGNSRRVSIWPTRFSWKSIGWAAEGAVNMLWSSEYVLSKSLYIISRLVRVLTVQFCFLFIQKIFEKPKCRREKSNYSSFSSWITREKKRFLSLRLCIRTNRLMRLLCASNVCWESSITVRVDLRFAIAKCDDLIRSHHEWMEFKPFVHGKFDNFSCLRLTIAIIRTRFPHFISFFPFIHVKYA